MGQTKQDSKRGRRKKALPVIGIAGVSLSLAGGAYASTVGSTTDIQSQNTSPRHEVFIGEEEITDVSLGTFYVFDKENAAKPRLGEQVAWWRGCGGCGCGGCGYALWRLWRLRRLRLVSLQGWLSRLLDRSLSDKLTEVGRHGPGLLDAATAMSFCGRYPRGRAGQRC